MMINKAKILLQKSLTLCQRLTVYMEHVHDDVKFDPGASAAESPLSVMNEIRKTKAKPCGLLRNKLQLGRNLKDYIS